MLPLVPSVIGLKQNLQKSAAKICFCPVGPSQGSSGGRRRVAQEGAPELFVKKSAGSRTRGRANPRSPPARARARRSAAHHVGRAEIYVPTTLAEGAGRLETPLTRRAQSSNQAEGTAGTNLGLWSRKDTWRGEQICRLGRQNSQHVDHQEQGETALSRDSQNFQSQRRSFRLELRPGAWPRAAPGGVGRVLRDRWSRTQAVLRSSSLHQACEGEPAV